MQSSISPGIPHFWGRSHKRGAETVVISHRLRFSIGEFTNILKICKPSHPNSNLCPRNTEDLESESRTPWCSVLCQSKLDNPSPHATSDGKGWCFLWSCVQLPRKKYSVYFIFKFYFIFLFYHILVFSILFYIILFILFYLSALLLEPSDG